MSARPNRDSRRSRRSMIAGMKAMMEHFGIDCNEIMAIGDSHNDIEMLDYAAVAVCMGNAPEQVCRHADYVTADTDGDGVYRALVHYGLLEG